MKKQKVIRIVMYVWGTLLFTLTMVLLIRMMNEMGLHGTGMHAGMDTVEFVTRGCWG